MGSIGTYPGLIDRDTLHHPSPVDLRPLSGDTELLKSPFLCGLFVFRLISVFDGIGFNLGTGIQLVKGFTVMNAYDIFGLRAHVGDVHSRNQAAFGSILQARPGPTRARGWSGASISFLGALVVQSSSNDGAIVSKLQVATNSNCFSCYPGPIQPVHVGEFSCSLEETSLQLVRSF
jgi:hypothetical protein